MQQVGEVVSGWLSGEEDLCNPGIRFTSKVLLPPSRLDRSLHWQGAYPRCDLMFVQRQDLREHLLLLLI
ncbi:hypothetical protein [Dyella acidisoli]|uniref:hypothetical protein n=1 Tax=Dyella acidisoli TaxID=1867834 RepID=UPI003C2ED16C